LGRANHLDLRTVTSQQFLQDFDTVDFIIYQNCSYHKTSF